MSRSLDLTANDTTLARQTGDYLAAIRFDENRKANYSRVLSLCEKADLFITQGDAKKMHLVAFARTAEGTKLCYAVLEEMRRASWKFSIFANDRFQKNRYALVNMLDCSVQALGSRNYKSHCHKVLEDPFEKGDPESTEVAEYWLLPCQLLDGHINFDKHDTVDIYSRLEAAALSRNANLCTLYRPEDFDLIKTLKKSKPKKFWD
jgi:hypothetical protein